MGVLLVFALVLGSTGFALAAYDDDMGKGNQGKARDGSCLEDAVTILADQTRYRACDEECDPDGDVNHKGWN